MRYFVPAEPLPPGDAGEVRREGDVLVPRRHPYAEALKILLR